MDLAPLPPQEAIDFFEKKGMRPSWNWPEVWKEEHAAAFTVAKATQLDVLTDLRQAVDDAIRNGTTLEDFKRGLIPTLQDKGWWGRKVVDGKSVQLGSPARLKTIFETNTRVAYAVGQEERAQRVKRTHPFFVYELGPSRKHRAEHAAWEGTTLPQGHPWWDTHAPQNGWKCKCRRRLITRAEAERLGAKVGEVPEKNPMVEYRDKVTGRVVQVEQGIDPGWDYNPGKVGAARLHDVMADKYQAAPYDLAAAVSRSHVDGPAFKTWQEAPKGDFPLAVAPPDLAKALNTPARVVRFSPETAAKQLRKHPEVKEADYLAVQAMLEDGEVYTDGAQRVMVVYRGDAWWRAAVKTTGNREELFLLSLHKVDEKTLLKIRQLARIR